MRPGDDCGQRQPVSGVQRNVQDLFECQFQLLSVLLQRSVLVQRDMQCGMPGRHLQGQCELCMHWVRGAVQGVPVWEHLRVMRECCACVGRRGVYVNVHCAVD